MKHFMAPRPVGLSTTGQRLSLSWTLRLLILVVGVLAMHLWVGPGPMGAAASTHGAAPIAASSASAPTLDAPSNAPVKDPSADSSGTHTRAVAVMGAGYQVLPAASTVTGHGSSDGSSCADICPNGHSMMTAMCIALLVIGAAGLYWLRSALLSRWTLLRGPPVRTNLPVFRPRTVSLVQLSISRT